MASCTLADCFTSGIITPDKGRVMVVPTRDRSLAHDCVSDAAWILDIHIVLAYRQ
jgi:hypothetical protein